MDWIDINVQGFVGTTVGMRPLGRPRRIWEDNIKMDRIQDGDTWTGLIWLRIWTGCGHL